MRSKHFYKLVVVAIIGIIGFTLIYDKSFAKKSVKKSPTVIIDNSGMQKIYHLYDSLRLDSLELSKDAFVEAMEGLDSLQTIGVIKRDSIISIVDFSLPSYKKRLFVIDLALRKVLFNTLVSHGRNSGKEIATNFSNELNSFASSLGFYITGDTYKGEHGYSLRLQGLEQGINDNAFNRGIVMHSAPYVNEKLIQSQGYIGRSLGCPAVPIAVHKAIIRTIKDGSCLFLYSPDKDYLTHTRFSKSSGV